jgi:cell division protease FtsH
MFDDEEDPKRDKEDYRPRPRPRSMLVLLVVAVVVLLLILYGRTLTGSDTTLQTSVEHFLELKKKGYVKEVWVSGNTLEAEMQGGFTDGGKSYKRIAVTLPPAFTEDSEGWKQIKEDLPDAKKIHFEQPGPWVAIVAQFIPWVILILLAWWFFIRQIRASGGPGNVLSFGRSRAKFVAQDKVRTTFDDVAGIDEAKDEVREIIEFLKDPSKFQRLGGRIPRGVLLVGPPGTGKTLLAKAMAGEAGVRFLSITGSDFVEMFVGVGAARVRDLFNTAKEKAPCIVFIDEIDAVGRRRGTGLGGGHDEREQTLNQILVEMDGFDTDEGVIVVAATNRQDVLDPALLRPGRFDREVYLDLPDVKGREDILKVHAKKVKLGRDVDLRQLATATPMFSGADLANIINEAAIIATMKHAESVVMSDLTDARDKVIFGRQKKSRVMDEKEKRLTAYHEAGHTLLYAKLLSDVTPVHKVTIIPRGRALGVTMAFPDKDRYNLPKDQCLKQLRVSFGGRVAEELVFGELSAGAADDIKKATQLARRMVCEWGMSEKLGPVNYTEEEEHFFLGREIARTNNLSEETQKAIDAEIRALIEAALADARQIVAQNRDGLDKIGQALLRYETLTGAEVMKLLAGEDIDAAKERERAASARAEEEKRAEERKRDAEPGWKPKPLPGPQQA